MRPICISLLTFTVMTLSASDVFAMAFGADENIHTIQEIQGTEYRLCHKTTLQFFVLGIYMTDDGYVLQKQGMFDSYIPLDETEIREMQKEGTLPNPLPEYSISMFEYVFGYSLWILIAFMLACAGVSIVVRRFSGSHRIQRLLANPHYKEAFRIALNSNGNGVNEAVDYLQSKGVPLAEAQTNMQLLLSNGALLSL